MGENSVKQNKIFAINRKINVLDAEINKAKNKLKQVEKIIEKGKEREYDLKAIITDNRAMIKNLEKFKKELTG